MSAPMIDLYTAALPDDVSTPSGQSGLARFDGRALQAPTLPVTLSMRVR